MEKQFKVVWLGGAGPFLASTGEAKELAKVNVELVEATGATEDEVIEATKDADVILRIGRAQITRRVMEVLPKCKAIIFGSVGYDRFDVDAATDNNIIVVNNPAPEWCIEEVSNHAIALLLVCAKKLVLLNSYTKQGRWAEGKRLCD